MFCPVQHVFGPQVPSVCRSSAQPAQQQRLIACYAAGRSQTAGQRTASQKAAGGGRPRPPDPGPSQPWTGPSRNSNNNSNPVPKSDAVQDCVALTSRAPDHGTYTDIAWQAVQVLVTMCSKLGTDYWLKSTAAAIAQGAPLMLQAQHSTHTALPPYAPAEAPPVLVQRTAAGKRRGRQPQPSEPAASTAPADIIVPGLEIHVQWDALKPVHDAAVASLGADAVGQVCSIPGGSQFWCRVPVSSLARSGSPAGQTTSDPVSDMSAVSVLVACEWNKVVDAEPHRVLVRCTPADSTAPTYIWAESLWSVRRSAATSQASTSINRRTAPAQAGKRSAGKRASTLDDPELHSSGTMAPIDSATTRQQLVLACDVAQAVTQRLAQLQAEAAAQNSSAWADSDTFAAFSERFGSPERAAAWVVSDPVARLGSWMIRAFTEARASSVTQLGASAAGAPDGWVWGSDTTNVLKGQRVANLLGSHGLKALAMAHLGAEMVTVVDVSPGNARYALEAATHAKKDQVLRYIVSDVLHLHTVVPRPGSEAGVAAHPATPTVPPGSLWACQDWVVMENGILHYFFDLQALFQVVVELLAPGGRLLLRDFHPVSTKILTSRGNKHKVTGDYFDSRLVGTQAAFTKYTGDTQGPGAQQEAGVLLRRWTLGEIVTACAASGLRIVSLDEEPGPKAADKGIPKSFTLLASWPGMK